MRNKWCLEQFHRHGNMNRLWGRLPARSLLTILNDFKCSHWLEKIDRRQIEETDRNAWKDTVQLYAAIQLPVLTCLNSQCPKYCQVNSQRVKQATRAVLGGQLSVDKNQIHCK